MILQLQSIFKIEAGIASLSGDILKLIANTPGLENYSA